MRKPVLLKVAEKSRRKVSATKSVPAPTGGWNALDSIADMPPSDAVTMKNWWPTTKDIMVRKGKDDHVTGFPNGQIDSLMPYVKPDGTESLFCAHNASFYDVTSPGAVGSSVATGLSNARWDSINFTNTSGNSYLCCFNGEDSARYWDNSSWITVNTGSSPGITGVATASLKAPWVHQRRMWLIEKNSLSAWYLPVDSVGGGAKEFNMSGLFKRGGHLIAGGAYTMDAGDGPDDYWYAISSEGEIIAYSGTDVTSLATWRLVGVWNVGEPIGERCLLRFRGDALIILREGVFPLSQALISASTDKTKAITNKIKDAMADAAVMYKNNFGWQIVFYPEVNMIILNVPVSEGANQEQYCMNIITGAWTRFTGINANCWTIFNGQPYYGGDGVVGKFWGSFSDNSLDINTDLQQAFNYFGQRGTLKSFSLIKPYLFSDGAPNILSDINVDFRDEIPTSSLSTTADLYGTWDSTNWDLGTWGGALNITDEWQHAFGVGVCAALRMQTASNDSELRLKSTDFVFENGGIVG